ncbi:F-box domain-containing protein [Mycena sanguinolenta]|uniref:F-box domain-containing protein n=1 Tax=Mycena sanguinolenta TaxID=230812 RepID=A0A8H7CT94_9AGAR|nr:F-box domain-containing protein [Mycena sanguinolenta]
MPFFISIYEIAISLRSGCRSMGRVIRVQNYPIYPGFTLPPLISARLDLPFSVLAFTLTRVFGSDVPLHIACACPIHKVSMLSAAVCWSCGAAAKPSPSLASLLEPPPLNPSPDILRLVNSNDAPLDSDISCVQQLISDAEDRLHALDEHILSLQTTLAQLVQRRSEITDSLCGHRAILSPVRRVPPELICEIFDFATAENRGSPRDRPPWWVGFISRPWRYYALGYPALWSSLTVPASKRFRPDTWIDARFFELETQLLRCGAASLHIHWSNVSTTSPNSRILDLILPRSNSWCTVSFDIDKHDAALDWLEPVRGRLDSLEKLEVLYNLCTFPTVFTTAPNLRHVALPLITTYNDSSSLSYQASVPLPWGQITQYSGKCPFAEQLDILRAAPNLSDCALDIKEDFRFVPPKNATVILPRLRRLYSDRLGCFLPIVAPGLEEFCSLQSMWLIPLIIPFVRQLSCTLQRLLLWRCPLSSELITTLRDLPSLTYLLIQNDRHDESDGVAFFAAMSTSGTSTAICPVLTSMVFGCVHWESRASHDAFVLMVRSRFGANLIPPSGTRFPFLHLLSTAPYSDHSSPGAEIKARIQSLQDEGFNVAFLG